MKNMTINNGIKAIIDAMDLGEAINFSRNIAPQIGEYLFRFWNGRFLVSDFDSKLFQIKRLR